MKRSRLLQDPFINPKQRQLFQQWLDPRQSIEQRRALPALSAYLKQTTRASIPYISNAQERKETLEFSKEMYLTKADMVACHQKNDISMRKSNAFIAAIRAVILTRGKAFHSCKRLLTLARFEEPNNVENSNENENALDWSGLKPLHPNIIPNSYYNDWHPLKSAQNFLSLSSPEKRFISRAIQQLFRLYLKVEQVHFDPRIISLVFSYWAIQHCQLAKELSFELVMHQKHRLLQFVPNQCPKTGELFTFGGLFDPVMRGYNESTERSTPKEIWLTDPYLKGLPMENAEILSTLRYFIIQLQQSGSCFSLDAVAMQWALGNVHQKVALLEWLIQPYTTLFHAFAACQLGHHWEMALNDPHFKPRLDYEQREALSSQHEQWTLSWLQTQPNAVFQCAWLDATTPRRDENNMLPMERLIREEMAKQLLVAEQWTDFLKHCLKARNRLAVKKIVPIFVRFAWVYKEESNPFTRQELIALIRQFHYCLHWVHSCSYQSARFHWHWFVRMKSNAILREDAVQDKRKRSTLRQVKMPFDSLSAGLRALLWTKVRI